MIAIREKVYKPIHFSRKGDVIPLLKVVSEFNPNSPNRFQIFKSLTFMIFRKIFWV